MSVPGVAGERADDGHRFASVGDERFYVVTDIDRIPPFLMSIVSDGDRWMFVSSSGALTAGRRDAHHALFPYETDDRLHRLGGLNGAATAIRFGGDPDDVWRPVSGPPTAKRRRSLYKAVLGNSVIFEERDDRSGLTFRSRWSSSDRFGFIRTAELANHGTERRRVDLIDGLRNLLPHGLSPSLYLPMGNLTNAYKRSELVDPDLRLAVYSLESLVTDKPEPAEAMRATTTWSLGLENADVSLRPDAIRFASGGDEPEDRLVTGMPGAYFLRAVVDLEPGDSTSWTFVSDVGLDQPAVASLIRDLRSMPDAADELAASIETASARLREIMARADSLQSTADEVAASHHLANVTYNVMRGGVPMDGYRVEVADFLRHLERRNRPVATRHRETLSAMGSTVQRRDLLAAIDQIGDVALQRLSREYLPFSFSRRHGDPSRPWNAFSIRTTDDEGRPVRYFEGNWRDIFQNWEAMATSFPDYLPDIISVFVDASTPDGFNPYRLTSDGVDWEVPDPEDPWSNIGYWGDHQIVYLLRLLEETERYLPGTVRGLLAARRFTYADVPYRIAPYEDILEDPKETIAYDEEAAAAVAARVDAIGFDGRLVWVDDGVYHVTLAEKLLVPALAKLSNFVPGGGIWMNTQRPEWNDANNALVGYGLSMVTLYQLRSYLLHLRELHLPELHLPETERGSPADIEMSREVADWLGDLTGILSRPAIDGSDETADQRRKQLMDALGSAFSDYRRRVYEGGFTGTTRVPLADVAALCDAAMVHLDATISTSRRADGLYESYNLIRISDDGGRATVDHLEEMLEGQVAVMSSGVLDANECADLVDALFASALYRADQESFLLYPTRRLPSFLERNIVPPPEVEANPLLAKLLERDGGTIVTRDVDGRIRFNAELTTRDELERHLDRLATDETWGRLADAHRGATIRTYQRVFGHHSYTGRSGSMYAYEGLGSIYWHMVAKLLVAIQESVLNVRSPGDGSDATRRLIESYWRVRSGLGFNKPPEEHGAIPIDPYSHTPSHAGAQQPGMTGLVKEEILARPAELGVIVDRGEIGFDSVLLSPSEILREPRTWSVFDASFTWRDITLPARSVASTVCQVPVVVVPREGAPSIDVELVDGRTEHLAGRSLGRDLSSAIFQRTGEVALVRAYLAE